LLSPSRGSDLPVSRLSSPHPPSVIPSSWRRCRAAELRHLGMTRRRERSCGTRLISPPSGRSAPTRTQAWQSYLRACVPGSRATPAPSDNDNVTIRPRHHPACRKVVSHFPMAYPWFGSRSHGSTAISDRRRLDAIPPPAMWHARPPDARWGRPVEDIMQEAGGALYEEFRHAARDEPPGIPGIATRRSAAPQREPSH
jgi:hypothetical protein